MHVLVFTAFFTPHINGIERYIRTYAKGLTTHDVKLTIVTYDQGHLPARDEIDGMQVYRLPSRKLLGGTFVIGKRNKQYKELMTEITNLDVDAVMTHTRFFPSTQLGTWFAKKQGLPLIHVEHGNRHVPHQNPFVRLVVWGWDHTLGRWTMKRADAVIAISKPGVEFCKHLGARPEKIHYIPNTIDLNKYDKNPVKHKGYRILFVGRLVKAKGVHDLLHAAKDMDVEVRIIGDGPYRDTLEKLAYTLDVNAYFLGEQDQEAVIKELQQADLFVNPSYAEGLPTSVLEAAAMGIPVVATDVGGTKDIITSRLVQPGSVTELGDAIADAMKTPPETFKDDVNKTFALDGLAQRLSNIIGSTRTASRTIWMSTSFRWNTLWSHSHELTKALSEHYNILYYEPPRLTTPRSPSLYEKSDFERPEGVEYIGTSLRFKGLHPLYMLVYWTHMIFTFMSRVRKVDCYVTYNIYDLPVLWMCKLLRKPVLFLFVDEYDKLTTTPMLKPYLRFALKRFFKADHVVCTAKVLAERARRHNDAVTYLPNAVNLDDVKSADRKPAKRFTIGFLGSIEPWVDLGLLINAAKKLPDVEFDIVGDGSDLKTHKEAAKELSNVTFHGRVPHERVYDHIRSWHLATIPFHRNEITDAVSPVKLFEYWLLATPVAATPTTELEQFKDVLIPLRMPQDIIDAITKAKADPEWLAKKGTKGQQLVQSKYNWQRYQQTYKLLIDSLLP